MAKKINLKTERINVRAIKEMFTQMKDIAINKNLSDSEVIEIALESYYKILLQQKLNYN